MARIKLDKKKLQIVIQCKTLEEMKLQLDYLSKGAAQYAKEVQEKAFGKRKIRCL